jgi:hypothetical protein
MYIPSSKKSGKQKGLKESSVPLADVMEKKVAGC